MTWLTARYSFHLIANKLLKHGSLHYKRQQLLLHEQELSRGFILMNCSSIIRCHCCIWNHSQQKLKSLEEYKSLLLFEPHPYFSQEEAPLAKFLLSWCNGSWSWSGGSHPRRGKEKKSSVSALHPMCMTLSSKL